MRDSKKLEVWRRGHRLTLAVYGATRAFPREELYGLTSQMRRASISIPSNTAEGYARRHNTEYKQYLFIALGSGAELTTQSIIAHRVGYLSRQDCDWLEEEVAQISKMTMSLIKKL